MSIIVLQTDFRTATRNRFIDQNQKLLKNALTAYEALRGGLFLLDREMIEDKFQPIKEKLYKLTQRSEWGRILNTDYFLQADGELEIKHIVRPNSDLTDWNKQRVATGLKALVITFEQNSQGQEWLKNYSHYPDVRSFQALSVEKDAGREYGGITSGKCYGDAVQSALDVSTELYSRLARLDRSLRCKMI